VITDEGEVIPNPRRSHSVQKLRNSRLNSTVHSYSLLAFTIHDLDKFWFEC